MSGIGRFLAAIVLAGAVGGVGVFARHIGSVPEPRAIHLTAPPPLHVAIRTTVAGRTFFSPRHRAADAAGRPAAPAAVGLVPVVAEPAPAAAEAPAPPVQAPVSAPAAPPAVPTPPAPAPPAPQEPPRVLTTVPVPVAALPGRHRGHAYAYGHLKHLVRGAHNGWPRPDDAAAEPVPPADDAAQASAPAAAAPVSAEPEASPDAPAPGHGNGHGGGNGHGKGHGEGG